MKNIYDMYDFFESLKNIDDPRQFNKVRYPINEIVGMVLIASLGNGNEWTEIEVFCKLHETLLKRYFKLENGVPSHDTFQRVMGMIEPNLIQQIQSTWNEYISKNDGESIKKILNIDGKTMRGSKTEGKKPLHIVSAWCDEEGVCFGQSAVKEKENEILAIPELLDRLQIKGYVVTIDAMGTQTKIAEKIIKKKADYVLAVKGNQEILHNDLITYFEDDDFREKIIKDGNYKKTVEKSHGQIEIREYYQTKDIKWLTNREKWKNLKSIGIVEKTIKKKDKESKEIRYYISSLAPEINLFEKAVRGHWGIEIMHWHLDVTFKEDSIKTVEETANKNMNIIRKWALSILKLLDMGKKMSLKLKRFSINCKPDEYISKIMEI
ncbi:ISAs1 family transposase [Clostridium sp. BJN0013]|jgi:predicted transposase YbfD/YdcC|uniref:ISAs1 family transposase n=1 Tax=Clostridium sp. BJN0013 TaxID=3236840 RepID=UPI0034C6C52D